VSIQLGATFATFTVTNPSLALERPVNLGSLGLSKLWEAKGRGKEINWIQPPPLQTFTFHLPPQPSPPKRNPSFFEFVAIHGELRSRPTPSRPQGLLSGGVATPSSALPGGVPH